MRKESSTRQPQRPIKINHFSGLTKGLVYCFNSALSDPIINLTNYQTPILVRSVATIFRTKQADFNGLSIYGDSTNWAEANCLIDTFPLTVFAYVFIGSDPNTVGPILTLYRGFGYTPIGLRFGSNFVGTAYVRDLSGTNIASVSKKAVLAICVYKANGDRNLYVNGKLIESVNVAIPNLSSYKVGLGYLVGSDGVWGALGPSNYILLSGIYNRELDVSEIESLSNNPWQIFKDKERRRWKGPTVVVQGEVRYSRPVSDSAVGSWVPSTGSSLYGTVDEVAQDDADYIYTTVGSSCSMALSTVIDPNTSSNQVLYYRAKSGTTSTLVTTLMQGATTIATRTHTGLTSSFAEYQMVLTTGECNSITDYSALKVQLTAV